jgi:hypothetical protein
VTLQIEQVAGVGEDRLKGMRDPLLTKLLPPAGGFPKGQSLTVSFCAGSSRKEFALDVVCVDIAVEEVKTSIVL